jgi:hypothetical protein
MGSRLRGGAKSGTVLYAAVAVAGERLGGGGEDGALMGSGRRGGELSGGGWGGDVLRGDNSLQGGAGQMSGRRVAEEMVGDKDSGAGLTGLRARLLRLKTMLLRPGLWRRRAVGLRRRDCGGMGC